MDQILESGIPIGTASASSTAGKSAVSWPSVFAGAFVAAAVSLILLALGSGLGFASVSIWPRHGVSPKALAISAVIWLIVMQWVSSAVGGYIAGRLRTRWHGTHSHEVFFRDTAHGFVTWAVATTAVAAIVTVSGLSALGAGASVAEGAMQSVAPSSEAYALDKLFRASGSGQEALAGPRAEASHMAANAMLTGSLPDADRRYLADLVAVRSGIAQGDAQKRVDDFVGEVTEASAKLKADAETARKSAMQAAIYTALALLVGAFIASVSAALGGRLRDEHI
jgi:hypothetical protein